MSALVQLELERVARSIAEGADAPLAGLSQEAFAALGAGERALARVRGAKHKHQHLAVRVLVAHALAGGVVLDTPPRSYRSLPPCAVCGVASGERCLRATGEKAHRPHKGRAA